jgi:hypothetical protein
MRRTGRSRAGTARELDVGSGTVARWFREDGVSPSAVVVPHGWSAAQQAAVHERWALRDQQQASHARTVGSPSDREVLSVGTAPCWAEGAKSKPRRRAHRVVPMNSDASTIRLFVSHLAVLGVDRSRTSCSSSIHEGADVARAEACWRDVVGDGVRWMEPSLERHDPEPVRWNRESTYRGCLRVEVLQPAADYRRIAGTWEGVAGASAGVDPPSSSG